MYLSLQRVLVILLLVSIVDGRRRRRTSTTTTTTTTRVTTVTTTSVLVPTTVTTTSTSAPTTTTTSTLVATTTTTSVSAATTTTSSSPAVTTSTTTTTGTSGSTTTTTPLFNLYRTQALEQSNYLRSTHCAGALTADFNITTIAQNYAQVLCANKSALAHSGNRYQGNALGENLYAVSSTNVINLNSRNGSIPVSTWYSEIQYYNFSNPVYSSGTAHFTQVVWLNSQLFGLGYCCSNDSLKCYVVANYYPAGNYQGAFAANVKPRTCG